MKKNLLFALFLGSSSLMAMDNGISPADEVKCQGNQCTYFRYLLRKGHRDSNAYTTFAQAAQICSAANGKRSEYSLNFSFYQETDRDCGSADMSLPCSREGVQEVLKTWNQPFSPDQKSYTGVNDYWCLYQSPYGGAPREPKQEIVSIEKK